FRAQSGPVSPFGPVLRSERPIVEHGPRTGAPEHVAFAHDPRLGQGGSLVGGPLGPAPSARNPGALDRLVVSWRRRSCGIRLPRLAGCADVALLQCCSPDDDIL